LIERIVIPLLEKELFFGPVIFPVAKMEDGADLFPQYYCEPHPASADPALFSAGTSGSLTAWSASADNVIPSVYTGSGKLRTVYLTITQTSTQQEGELHGIDTTKPEKNKSLSPIICRSPVFQHNP
jgi:hypothetical protein